MLDGGTRMVGCGEFYVVDFGVLDLRMEACSWRRLLVNFLNSGA